MAGDANNIAVWRGADVWVAPSLTVGPTDITTAWAAAWTSVGLLDASTGFEEARAEDAKDFYAWGGLLVRKTRSKHKRTLKFVALEDNLVTFGLINPGSTRVTAVGVTTDTVKVPSFPDIAVGFEMRDGLKLKRRSVKRAVVENVGTLKEEEGGMTMYEVTVAIFPEADGTLYKVVSGTLAS